MPIYDLTQRIENGMPIFPGDPIPSIYPVPENEPPLRVSHLVLSTHTGTHIDAPSHFIPDGKTIDQYCIDRFVLPGLVIEVKKLKAEQPIEIDHLAAALSGLTPGDAVLIRTDWSLFWEQPIYQKHPFLSQKAAELLVDAKAGLVGIDTLNVDSTSSGACLIHQILLGNDTLIVENLTGLAQMQTGRRYQFSFLPMFLTGLDGSPIRAVAW